MNWGGIMDLATILRAAKKGDNEAFIQLFKTQKEQLYRIAFAYFKNEQDALEAVQEVTFRAYKNIKRLKEPKYFSTWLTRIMINYCIDELKRKNRFLLSNSKAQTGSVLEEKDKHIGIETAIQMLEPKFQEIIVLKYFQDMTIEQIADHLSRPSGTIKTWLSKALQELRKHITKEDGFHV
jgi:RNA polymerase sigma-70 factor (ECF subfamily)